MAEPIIINGRLSGLPSFRYPDPQTVNPAFDGAGFIKEWARHVGSTHRHWKTDELVLFWSARGPYPEERERLRALLERDEGNIGAVLAAYDAEMAAFNAAILNREVA